MTFSTSMLVRSQATRFLSSYVTLSGNMFDINLDFFKKFGINFDKYINISIIKNDDDFYIVRIIFLPSTRATVNVLCDDIDGLVELFKEVIDSKSFLIDEY